MFCAVAMIALTTSAQQTDVSKGSMYLGVTNAMDIMDEDVELAYTVGYAVQDGLVVMISSVQESDAGTAATDTTAAVDPAPYADRTMNLHIRYFKNGYYGQVNLNDFRDATGLDPDMTLSVGAMYNIGAIDGMYIDPNMTLGRDAADDVEMSFNLGLGMRF